MILYKYLTEQKADEWLIGEDSLLLTPPKFLNDLLEFRISREPEDLEERRSDFKKYQLEQPSTLNFDEYDREVASPESINLRPETMRTMLSEVYGVLSLARDPLDELMWAHYGLKSGVAVGYQAEHLIEIDGIRGAPLPFGMAMKVRYKNDVVPMQRNFSDAAHQLTTKRECWRYENEWRVIRPLNEGTPKIKDQNIFYKLPGCREQIHHIVFGANAGTDFIMRVKGWLHDGTARTQKASINPDTHELELSDI